jgi:hypothetical protein
VTDVVTFEIRDPWVRSQALVELTMADIQRDDVVGTALQQAVREPAGGRADVECSSALDFDVEHIERMVQLGRTSTDELGSWALDPERVCGIDLSRRLVGNRAVDQHAIGRDQRLRF